MIKKQMILDRSNTPMQIIQIMEMLMGLIHLLFKESYQMVITTEADKNGIQSITITKE